MNLKDLYKKETGKNSIEYCHQGMMEWTEYKREYVHWLEKKLKKIKSAIIFTEKWSKDQSNGLTDGSICISALKDIRRYLK